MKRLWVCVSLCVIALAGISFGQDGSEPLFVFERQIGQLRPTGIQYDPVFDRFAWVDLNGQLVLADAATYSVQHVLYTNGVYNAYKFSHDGRHLALAIDRRIELWDTRTGELAETFEPTGALQANGPLTFSADDALLLVNTLVPAPPELRRSENDTSNLPWIWDVADALDEAEPSLPRRAENVPFFDFRNGLIIGPNRTLIGGYPSRLVVIDGTSADWRVDAEISSSRAEQDPIYIWQSATDDYLYVDPRLNTFVQVDTRDNTTVDLPLGRGLGLGSAERLASEVEFSRTAQIVGGSNHVYSTSLGRLIYGDGYVDGENGRTLMLLDILQPLTVPADQTALLMYNYSEREESGVMELVQLSGNRLLMTPDGQRLIVRRNGAQIEIYDIASGVLERTIYPAEPDNGTRTFALTADGKTLLVDFQRFDVLTGEMTAHATEYTRGAEDVFYAEDGSALVTRRGEELTFRDVETGAAKRTALVEVNGSVLDASSDSLRYLLQGDTGNGTTLEIYDVQTGERRSTTIGAGHPRITQIVPRADWQQFLVSYDSGGVAVYDFDGKRLVTFPADELPYNDGRQIGWLDDYSVYVASGNPSMPPPREYGFEYHPSGIPACLVAAYPAEWQVFISVWDSLNLRLSFSQLNDLSRRLCAKLPEQAAEVVPGLTPTPRFYYNALEGVRLQGALPDVPLCLTQAFPGEQLQYAELWRQLSEGLDEAGKTELANLLCEGLITSLSQIAATPTINPNLLSAGAPTAIPDAPESVSQREFGLTVVTIDIATAQRRLGTYIPDVQVEPQRSLSIIANQYAAQFGRQPGRFAVSPDGTRMAMLNDNGFIELYRLTRSYNELAADEANAEATRVAAQPRDIGLPATPTPGFVSIGGSLPTITPTITPTIPAPQTVDIVPVTEDVCPARNLYSLENLPPEYAASGRIVTSSPTGDRAVWVFEPESGYWRAVEGLPLCGINENCTFSADKAWILRPTENGGVVVSRPDGTDATTLFRGGVEDVPLRGYRFVNQHTVEYEIEVWLPEKYPSPVTLFARFDPETGESTEPAERQQEILKIEELPTSVISVQPMEGPLRLLSTPYRNASGGNGARFYIYDTRDDTYEYFARSDNGSLSHQWEARGTALYYNRPDSPWFYIYDTAAKTHQRIERYSIPSGQYSNDLRYTAYTLSPIRETFDDRLAAGELPLKIAVWDSETLTTRRYCLPETGADFSGWPMIWSPDGRYLLFRIQPQPPGADHFPTPVGEETPPPPTATPVPLDLQYDLQFQRTLILDTQTGYVTVLSSDMGQVMLWMEDAR
jgi:WD40 repeat protein